MFLPLLPPFSTGFPASAPSVSLLRRLLSRRYSCKIKKDFSEGGWAMKQDLMTALRGGESLTRLQQTKLIAQLSWPAIMGQLSLIAMQYIDAAMVGRLGSNESAAIGLDDKHQQI